MCGIFETVSTFLVQFSSVQYISHDKTQKSSHSGSHFCDDFNYWVHANCNDVKDKEYCELQDQDDDIPWLSVVQIHTVEPR